MADDGIVTSIIISRNRRYYWAARLSWMSWRKRRRRGGNEGKGKGPGRSVMGTKSACRGLGRLYGSHGVEGPIRQRCTWKGTGRLDIGSTLTP